MNDSRKFKMTYGKMKKNFVLGFDESLDITPYDHSKDKQFIMLLIEDNPRFLSYEYAGKP